MSVVGLVHLAGSHQEAFIPLDEELPEIPTDMNDLPAVIKAAKEWGCKIRMVNNQNDIGVSHPLLIREGRLGISVSKTRDDVPRSIVSFLRRVEREAVKYRQLHPEKIRKVPVVALKQPERPAVPAPVIHQKEPAVAAPAESHKQEEEVIRPKNEDRDTLYLETDIVRTIRTMASSVHFRHHDTVEDPITLEGCKKPVCIRANSAIVNVGKLCDMIAAKKEELEVTTQMLQEMDKELEESRKLVKMLKENEEMREKMAATQAAEANERSGNYHMPKAIIPSRPVPPSDSRNFNAGIIPDALRIEKDDRPETVRQKLSIMHGLFAEALSHAWKSDGRGPGNVLEAIESIASKTKHPETFESAYRSANFGLYKMAIMEYVRPGGARAAVGKFAFEELENACAKIRKQAILKGAGTQPQHMQSVS